MKKRKTTEVSVGGRMDKDVCVSPHAHTHPEFYLDTAKNKVLPSVKTWRWILRTLH